MDYIALAYWDMDQGSKVTGAHGFNLHTEGYTVIRSIYSSANATFSVWANL